MQQTQSQHGLSKAQIERYSRQLLLPELGVMAGIGHLGIVDFDTVDESNLQRQVIHNEERVGTPKTESAAKAVADLSSHVRCTTFNTLIDSSNAMDIVKDFEYVVDATDNAATRYLLNDACVLLGKTLVSGSALRMDGQLTVYNHNGGPCYRCIFPVPPPPETVTNCNDGGVLGVVPGIIGCIQALEVIKLVAGIPTSFSQKMLLFDAMEGTFRTIKLRAKNKQCAVCGDTPTITAPIDYVLFCGASANDKTRRRELLSDEQRITCQQYNQIVQDNQPHVLLDVRQKVQFDICSLPHSHHIPLAELGKHIDRVSELQARVSAQTGAATPVPVYVVCRRGNDSQLAVDLLQKHGIKNAYDLVGGLTAWSETVDASMPIY
eukprot:jgi/Hompol1/6763/HPOL_003800-RA